MRLEIDADTAQGLRERLVLEVEGKMGRGLPGPVRDAFLKVPRHVFVSTSGVEPQAIYSDQTLVVGADEQSCVTSSTMPILMAWMLLHLDVQEGHRVMEVGTGTGYNAAVLAELTGRGDAVHTIEIVSRVAKASRGSLGRAGYDGVHVYSGNGKRGIPAHAPYDRIVATTAVVDIPPEWAQQLATGGLLVAPLALDAHEPETQATVRLVREGKGLVGTFEHPTCVSFILMTDMDAPHPRCQDDDIGLGQRLTETVWRQWQAGDNREWRGLTLEEVNAALVLGSLELATGKLARGTAPADAAEAVRGLWESLGRPTLGQFAIQSPGNCVPTDGPTWVLRESPSLVVTLGTRDRVGGSLTR